MDQRKNEGMKVGLVYGSDTGMTEEVTNEIVEKCAFWDVEVKEVKEVRRNDPSFIQKFNFVILGLSTWYDGDLQSDWEDYFDEFKTIDFSGKIVALFGLGDQLGYDAYFIDGVGMLAEVVLENGGEIIGNWPAGDYDFSESKAQMNDSTFYGLALDEDNEGHATEERIDKWVLQIRQEFEIKKLLTPERA